MYDEDYEDYDRNSVAQSKGSQLFSRDDLIRDSDMDDSSKNGKNRISYLRRDSFEEKLKKEEEQKQAARYEAEKKHSLVQAREQARKHLKEIDSNMVPGPIRLMDRDEESAYEDQLRQAKELEYRRRVEEDQRQKQQALEAQQEKRKVQSISKDIKSKKYTYDYNGKVIITQNFQPEKLPPSTFTVNYTVNVETPEDQLLRSNKFNAKTINSHPAPTKTAVVNNQKLAQYNEKQMAKYITASPQIFEVFQPQKGVKMIEGGRQKEGQKFDSQLFGSTLSPTTTSITSNGTRSMLLNFNNDGKMRRDDYMNMMRAQNYTRNPLMQSTSSQETKYAEKLDYSNKQAVPKDTLMAGMFPKQENSEGSKSVEKTAKNWNSTQQASSITVHSSTLLESLLQKDSNAHHQNFSHPISPNLRSNHHNYDNYFTSSQSNFGNTTFKGLNNMASGEGFKATSVDNFNLGILQSKDWGRNKQQPQMISQGPAMLPKATTKSLQSSLGIKSKPRERLLKANNNLAKSSLAQRGASTIIQ